MAELADAPDLGSGGDPVQVQVLLPARLFLSVTFFLTKEILRAKMTLVDAKAGNMRKCRNWQTSKTKDLVAVMSCGFKSHLPHFLFTSML